MHCEYCGEELKEGQLFCPKCGSKIEENKKDNKKKTNKGKIIIALVCCVALIISGTIGCVVFKHRDNSKYDYDNNYVALEEGFTDVKVTDEKTALQAIDSVADIIGIDDVNSELKTERVYEIDNTTYYRFQQYYNDIPVYGKNVNLPVYADGQVAGLTSNFYVLNTDLSTEATVSKSDIEKSLKKHFENQEFIIEDLDSSKLVYFLTEDSKTILTYKLLNTVPGYIVFVNANKGNIVYSNNLFCYDSAEVQSEDGKVKAIGWKNDDGSYHLYNDEYKISVFDMDGTQTRDSKNYIHVNLKEYGIDTMYSKNNIFFNTGIIALKSICSISEFYKKLGFDGFERLHVGINDNDSGNNAGALGGIYDGVKAGTILIGNGIDYANIDVLAHEYTHSVSGLLVGWNRIHYENSAINEAYSDVFGILYENIEEPDWVLVCGDVIRDIANPSKYGYPVKQSDENKSTEDDGHAYSTVISHSAYLMWNGLDGTEKNKIPSETLAKLWYNSLFLLQSNSTFSQCRNAFELSARIMMKNDELTMDQYR